MNNPYKTILWVVALALIAWGVWSLGGIDSKCEGQKCSPTDAETVNTGSSVSSGSSVDEDLSSIDSELKSLESDSAKVGEGINDRAIPQEE